MDEQLLRQYPAYTKHADGTVTPHHVVKQTRTTVPAKYSRLNKWLNRNFGTNYQTEHQVMETELSDGTIITHTHINHRYENWN